MTIIIFIISNIFNYSLTFLSGSNFKIFPLTCMLTPSKTTNYHSATCYNLYVTSETECCC